MLRLRSVGLPPVLPGSGASAVAVVSVVLPLRPPLPDAVASTVQHGVVILPPISFARSLASCGVSFPELSPVG